MLLATTSESFSKIKSKKPRRVPFYKSDRNSYPTSNQSNSSSTIPADISTNSREHIIVAALLRAQQYSSCSSCTTKSVSSVNGSYSLCFSENASSSKLSTWSQLSCSNTFRSADSKAIGLSKNPACDMASGKRGSKNLSRFTVNSKGEYCTLNEDSLNSFSLDDDQDTLQDVDDATLSEARSVVYSENSEHRQMRIKCRNELILKKMDEEMKMINELEQQDGSMKKCSKKTECTADLPVEKPKIVVKSKTEVIKNEKAQREVLIAKVLKNINENKYFVAPPKKSTYEDWKKIKDEETKEKNLQKEKMQEALQEKRKVQAELNRIVFAKWYEESKNKPKPQPIMPTKYLAPTVTQSGPSLNWNPIPWIDNWSENVDDDCPVDQRFKNISKSDTQTNVKRNVNYRGNPRMAGRPYTKSDFLVRAMLESSFSTKAFLLGEKWIPPPTAQKPLNGNSQRLTQSETKTSIRKESSPGENKGISNSNGMTKSKIPLRFNNMKCIDPMVASNSAKCGIDSVMKRRTRLNTQSSTRWEAAVDRESCDKNNVQSETKLIISNNMKVTPIDKKDLNSRKKRINVGKR